MCHEWKDEKSIVATLRQCNYNVEDTISFYLSIKDEGVSVVEIVYYCYCL